jgi:predicted SpoU family rRNA methylase
MALIVVIAAVIVVLVGAAAVLVVAGPFSWRTERDAAQGGGDSTGNPAQSPGAPKDFTGELVWMKSYGGRGDDQFLSAASTPDGGFVAVGFSQSSDGDLSGNRGLSDFAIARFDADGNKVWLKTYGGNGRDIFNSVVATPDGGFVAVGGSESSNGDLLGNKGLFDFVIARFDADGNKVWLKTYGGNHEDLFNSVTSTMDGGFVAVGYSASSDGDLSDNKSNGQDFVIARFNADGNKVWLKTYGGSLADVLSSVTSTSDGGFVAVGDSASSDGDLSGNTYGGNRGHSDAIIVKLDADGNKVWLRDCGGSNYDFFNSVTSMTDGGFVAVGYSDSSDSGLWDNKGDGDFVVIRFDENGKGLWSKNYGGSDSEGFTSVAQVPGGGFIIAGASESSDGDLANNRGDNVCVIARFGANDELLWLKPCGETTEDYFSSVILTSDGGFVVVGWSESSDGDLSDNGGGRDFVVARFE